MIEGLTRNLRVLWRAETIVNEIRLQRLATRTVTSLAAALIAVFGLGMLNLAGYLALAPVVGPVWGAVLTAVADFALAGLLLLLGSRAGSDREMALALEVRGMALDALEADARDLQSQALALRDQLVGLRSGMASFVRHPLDGALPGLLVPLAGIVLKSLRRKRETPPA